ncbi:MAG: hypothetical protein RL375_2270 [Pseudomonadota bacterium]
MSGTPAPADGKGAASPGWLRRTAVGGVVDLAVIPNARRNEWAGLHDGALRLRLAAPPVDGAANQALLRWLAKDAGLRLADVELVSGQSARRKRVALTCEPAVLARWQASVEQRVLALTAAVQDGAGTSSAKDDDSAVAD